MKNRRIIPNPFFVFAAISWSALSNASEQEDGASSGIHVEVHADDFVPNVDVNMTDFQNEIKQFLTEIPPEYLDGLAVFGIVFGLLFTFFGAKFMVFGSFVLGSTVGGVLAQVILNRFPEVPVDDGFVIILVCAISFGMLTVCVFRLAKIIVGLALGLMVAALLYQYGLPGAVKSDGILIAMIILEVCVCILISYKSFNYAVAVCSSLLGGIFFILGVNRFIMEETEFTFSNFIDNPRVESCHTPACWSLLAAGVFLATSGTFIQWRRMCDEDGGLLAPEKTEKIKYVVRSPRTKTAEKKPDYIEII